MIKNVLAAGPVKLWEGPVKLIYYYHVGQWGKIVTPNPEVGFLLYQKCLRVLVTYSWHCSKKINVTHTSKTAIWASKHHSIQSERGAFEVMGKMSDYRQTGTD